MEFKAFCIFVILLNNNVLGNFGAFPSKIRRKPTNSLTIRQSGVCTNQSFGEFVQNPDDCRLFYLCVENGQAVTASCPPTMLFNPQSKLCDTPTNVKCSTDIVSTTVRPSPNNPGTSGADDINSEIIDAARYCATLTPEQETNRIIFIGSSTNCQQYYICYYGRALLQECSANLHWNAEIGKCDLPGNAACTLGNNATNEFNSNNGNNNGGQQNGSGSGSNTNSNGLHTTEMINCPIWGQHIYPHMERCDFFIYCVKGHAILQMCPFYFHFDIVGKSCKWRTSALCVRDLNINFKKLIQPPRRI